MEDEIYLIADPHLNSKSDEVNELFEKFLRIFESSPSSKLIMLGDLFSNWIGMDDLLSDYQKEIIKSLNNLKGNGKEIIFLEGNRDYFVEELEETPFFFIGKNYKMEFKNDTKILFEHGETINWKDRNYLLWSYITRTESVKSLLKILKKDFAKKLGEKLEEKLSRTNYEHKIEIPFDEIKNYAKSLREENYTNLVLGHFHRSLEYEFYGVKVNLIDTFMNKGSFAIINSNGRIETRYVI